MGHQVADLGTDSTQAVDYPDYARAVAQAVLEGRAERHRRRLGKIAAFEANFGK